MHIITAPPVNSTLDNILYSDSRSGHFTKLCTCAQHESMFFTRPVTFENSSLLFCHAQRSVISLTRFIQQFEAVLVIKIQHLCERSLIHSAKRCRHKNVQMTAFLVRECSCCVPSYRQIYYTVSISTSQKRTHCVDGRRIYYWH
jgi:hypothetical protein